MKGKYMNKKTISENEQKCFDYCDDAAKSLACDAWSGAAMRLAVLRFILDKASITEPPARAKVGKAFMAMPSWFGSNASAGRQARGIEKGASKVAGLEDLEF